MSDIDIARLGLAEMLINEIEWYRYQQPMGPADEVGRNLLSFLGSDRKTVGFFRDSLEDEVVPQANIYSAAEPVARVLVATLADPRPRWVEIAVMDLMFLILTGVNGGVDPGFQNDDLLERCVARIREGLWLVARAGLADSACYEAALDVLDLADNDRGVFNFVRAVHRS